MRASPSSTCRTRRRHGLLLALVALGVGACSGDDQGVAAPTAATVMTTMSSRPTLASEARTPTTAPDPAAVALRLEDYAIAPAAVSTAPGEVTVTVDNHDRAPHNVAILDTDAAAGELPTAGIRLDEANPAIAVVARTANLAEHETASLTVRLEPGRYVLVCTVPHHYVRDRMVGTLTVA